MQNFKQYLLEAKIDFAPWHDKDTTKYESRGLNRNRDGTYSCRNLVRTVRVFGEHLDIFPVKMKSIGNIDVSKVKSLWGFPDKVTNEASLFDCPELKHIDHVKTVIGGVLRLDLENLESIEPNSFKCKRLIIRDIGKLKLSEILKLIEFTSKVEISEQYLFSHRNILSLCKLPEHIAIEFPHFGDTETTQDYWKEAAKVLTIINKNRGKVIACQEELFQNNLDEYAKL